MRILIDTNILLWAITGNEKVDSIVDVLTSPKNLIYFSPASIWEIAIKHSKSNLGIPPDVAYDAAVAQGYIELPVRSQHAMAVETLNKPEDLDHIDPFDRILLAQAKHERLRFYTSDRKIAMYNEPGITYVS